MLTFTDFDAWKDAALERGLEVSPEVTEGVTTVTAWEGEGVNRDWVGCFDFEYMDGVIWSSVADRNAGIFDMYDVCCDMCDGEPCV